jgi:hypothetical protein
LLRLLAVVALLLALVAVVALVLAVLSLLAAETRRSELPCNLYVAFPRSWLSSSLPRFPVGPGHFAD